MQLQLRRIVPIAFLMGLVFASICHDCQAQMFGEQPVGSQGVLRGNERFIRGNRSRRDFVGSNRSDQTGFVGAQQALATGRVRPATEGLRIDQTNPNRINRPLAPQPPRGMYYPKLDVDWSLSKETSRTIQARSEQIDVRLQERFQRISGSQAQLIMDNSVAVLRGQVDSKARSELLEQLLEFEPGIDDVRNELQIAQGSETSGR